MCPGYNSNPQSINNLQNTVVIESSISVLTLPAYKTRLPDNGWNTDTGALRLLTFRMTTRTGVVIFFMYFHTNTLIHRRRGPILWYLHLEKPMQGVGTDCEAWYTFIGHHGIWKMNEICSKIHLIPYKMHPSMSLPCNDTSQASSPFRVRQLPRTLRTALVSGHTNTTSADSKWNQMRTAIYIWETFERKEHQSKDWFEANW